MQSSRSLRGTPAGSVLVFHITPLSQQRFTFVPFRPDGQRDLSGLEDYHDEQKRLSHCEYWLFNLVKGTSSVQSFCKTKPFLIVFHDNKTTIIWKGSCQEAFHCSISTISLLFEQNIQFHIKQGAKKINHYRKNPTKREEKQIETLCI